MNTFGVCNHQHIGPSSGHKYLCTRPYGHQHDHEGDGMVWTHSEGSYVPVLQAGTPKPVSLSQAEVCILLTALVPVEHFFPELRKKLELMQANG